MTKTWLGLLLGTLAALAQAQEPTPTREPAVEVGKDGSVTVRGTAKFTDLKQDVREKVRGSVRASLWYGKGGLQRASAEFEIVEGGWTATFPRSEQAGDQPARMFLSDARVDDQPVILEADEFDLTNAAELTLRLRAIPELRVRVVDAETKKELTEVDVFRRDDSTENTLHPGPGAKLKQLVGRGKSPLPVPPADVVYPRIATTLWVRAPGYAWQSVEVFFADGGLREVPLFRAGSAKLTITGNLPASEKVGLRVYATGGVGSRPLLELQIARAPALLKGITPGRYEVRLELGEWFRQPRVLAQSPLAVQAGQEASVELVVKDDVAAPERVTLRGSFVVPKGWSVDDDDVSVSLDPLQGTDRWTEYRYLSDQDLKRGSAEGEHRFEFPDTPVGRYVLTFEPSYHKRVVRVTKDAKDELRIELPDPVEVVIRVVDRDTKQPRKGVTLFWHPEWPTGVAGGSSVGVVAASDSNEVRMFVPAGRVVVNSFEEDFEVADATLDVTPKNREFEVFAVVHHGVKVALYEGTVRIPIGLGAEWEFSLLTVDGKRMSARESESGADLAFMVANPGTYVLRVKAPDGYKPVADRQVKLGKAPFPTIDIKVARK